MDVNAAKNPEIAFDAGSVVEEEIAEHIVRELTGNDQVWAIQAEHKKNSPQTKQRSHFEH